VRFQSNGTSNKRVKVYYGDVLEILRDRRRFKDGCVDLICTSPPYGDNGTTITYGQFSILQLRWIDIKDIEKKIDYKIIETQNAIDRMSLGGRSYSISTIENSGLFEKSKTSKEMHDFLVKQRREDKARKVSSFLIDYDKYFEQSVRVLRDGGYQVITLGNRTVHNKVISFDQITIELAEYYGLQYIWSFQRNIRNKRRPKTVNRDNTQTINQETIIILRKEE
jgi:site-specific DNA-methyltransferase (cytosine-N4-specific)